MATPEVKVNLSAGVTVIIPDRVLVLAAHPNALPKTVKLYSNVCSCRFPSKGVASIVNV